MVSCSAYPRLLPLAFAPHIPGSSSWAFPASKALQDEPHPQSPGTHVPSSPKMCHGSTWGLDWISSIRAGQAAKTLVAPLAGGRCRGSVGAVSLCLAGDAAHLDRRQFARQVRQMSQEHQVLPGHHWPALRLVPSHGEYTGLGHSHSVCRAGSGLLTRRGQVSSVQHPFLPRSSSTTSVPPT